MTPFHCFLGKSREGSAIHRCFMPRCSRPAVDPAPLILYCLARSVPPPSNQRGEEKSPIMSAGHETNERTDERTEGVIGIALL